MEFSYRTNTWGGRTFLEANKSLTKGAEKIELN